MNNYNIQILEKAPSDWSFFYFNVDELLPKTNIILEFLLKEIESQLRKNIKISKPEWTLTKIITL